MNSERILVVKRECLFTEKPFTGLMSEQRTDSQQHYASLINEHKEFLPRDLMEQDARYKQIIPYLVFTHKDSYFLMQRCARASESRLQSKFSLGIGGHIRQEDVRDSDIFAWARREFYEEVHYEGSLEVNFVGIVNDDSTEVGKVHAGFVFLLEGDSPHISVKTELAHGQMLTLMDCASYVDRMESWSVLVHNYLSINRFCGSLEKTS